MVKVTLTIIGLTSMLFIPGLIYWWDKWDVTDAAVMINSIIPIFVVVVACLAFCKIISVLEQIRDGVKKEKGNVTDY